ncbi:MAG: glycosyltransferase, partial [Thermoleophilaceae bacterium]|nr:glycosyltransferase [Thermoleophilaceae bacterium]
VLELAAACDSRIQIVDQIDQDQVGECIRQHDAVILPSPWDCSPNVGVEALASNRPLLATPVGGHMNLIVEGETGFFSVGTEENDLYRLVERALRGRDELAQHTRDRLPQKRHEQSFGPGVFCESLRELTNSPARWGATASCTTNSAEPGPLVSIVIPYFGSSRFIAQSVESVFAQEYRPIELLVVNDGSFDAADAVLEQLQSDYPLRVLSTVNAGQSAARNFGARHTTGEFLLFLDSDNTIEAGFITRAIAALTLDPEMAYVGGCLRFVNDENVPTFEPDGYRPIGNFSSSGATGTNIAGDTFAVIRRSSFEAVSGFDKYFMGSEDLDLYDRMRVAGQFGHIAPEFYCNYKVRTESASRSVRDPNQDSIHAQQRARTKQIAMDWSGR